MKRVVWLLVLCLWGCGREIDGGVVAALRVSPTGITFWDTVPREAPYLETLTLGNAGRAPLWIQGIGLGGDSAFSLPQRWTFPLILRPQQETSVAVSFQTSDSTVHRAEIWIDSNDYRTPRVRVPLRNVPALPHIIVQTCLRATAAAPCVPGDQDLLVRFEDIPRDDCPRAEITLENAGTAPLEVQAPFFREGSLPDFEFDGEPPGAFALPPPDGTTLGHQKVLKARYCQILSRSPSATLVLRSNDPSEPEVVVGLLGPTIPDTPPVCGCEPSILEASPLDTVTLSGAGCAETPLLYQWAVEQRPAGSLSQIRNATSRDATFFLDLATPAETPYILRVTATNPFAGVASCTYKVFAYPCCGGFHVQLVWELAGADVDLRLLGPSGECSAENPTPDWGASGDRADDPRCTADNAFYARPAAGIYRLGVRYACDHGLGPTGAKVRVFCNSQQVAEFGPRQLGASGVFWNAATLEWPGCLTTAVDEISTVPVGCGGL